MLLRKIGSARRSVRVAHRPLVRHLASQHHRQMYPWLIAVLLPAMAAAQCFSDDDTKVSPNQEERKVLYKGEQSFSIDLINALNDMGPTENIFVSPFSIYNALLLAYFASGSNTEAALKRVLHFPDNQDKPSMMRAYTVEKFMNKMRALNGSSDYELLNANKLFLTSSLNLRDCMKELFRDEIATTDFSKPEEAVSIINQWVANQTKYNIKDLLKPDHVSQATKLVLANAAYFKGMWKNKFQPESTRKEVFYITHTENTLVPMMRQKSTFNHLVSEKLGAHILEIPYKGDSVSMFFLLPPFASPSGITNILQRMMGNDFQKLTEELIQRQVDVSIPKFTFEIETNLVSVLKKLGVENLFETSSDLSALTGVNEVSLDNAVHKAKVSLDEEGTTAAAATAIFNFRSSRPLDPVRFTANHPFVYVLFDKSSQTILFIGVFNKPPNYSQARSLH